jgi:hypothetical protein
MSSKQITIIARLNKPYNKPQGLLSAISTEHFTKTHGKLGKQTQSADSKFDSRMAVCAVGATSFCYQTLHLHCLQVNVFCRKQSVEIVQSGPLHRVVWFVFDIHFKMKI